MWHFFHNLKRLSFFERYLWLVLSSFLGFIFVIFAVRFFVVSPGRVNGQSMEPNFIDENLFLVDRFSYLWHSPQRFDVVQVIDPETQHLIIKRVIGLPGENIEIKRGKIFIQKIGEQNFEELNESAYLDQYVYTIVRYKEGKVSYQVPDYYYFLVGDNRPLSVDSRIYGPLPRSVIVGKVFWVNKK